MSRFTLEGMTIRLDESAAALLEELSARFGADDSETVAKALSMMDFICEATGVDNDLGLFIHYPSGEHGEIIRFGSEVMVVRDEGQISHVLWALSHP